MLTVGVGKAEKDPAIRLGSPIIACVTIFLNRG